MGGVSRFRLGNLAVVDERGHQEALLDFTSYLAQRSVRFGEGHEAGCQLRMAKPSGKSHKAFFRAASAIYGT